MRQGRVVWSIDAREVEGEIIFAKNWNIPCCNQSAVVCITAIENVRDAIGSSKVNALHGNLARFI